jgi:flagellar hook assembly protein FlgD
LKSASKLKIDIFDIRGNIIHTLIDENRSAGEQEPVTWAGDNEYGHQVGSGLYFVRIKSLDFNKIIKIYVVNK